MSTINKILYLGTWHHIQPVRDFPLVKEFIFIDTQPRSEVDDLSFHIGFYKRNFFDDLIHKCVCFGFKLKSAEVIDPNYYKSIFTIKQRLYYYLWDILPNHINPTMLEFFNERTGQTIKYYISTNIQYTMTPNLQKDIEEADALLVSGYHPNIKLLEYFTKPKIFIGYTDTCYDLDKKEDNKKEDNKKEDKDTVISLLNQTFQSDYFDNYLLVSKKTGEIKKCIDIFDIKLTLIVPF